MSALTPAAASAGLRMAASNAIEDLQAASSVMIEISTHVPQGLVQPAWFALFGRQMEALAAEFREALEERGA